MNNQKEVALRDDHSVETRIRVFKLGFEIILMIAKAIDLFEKALKW